MSAQPLPSVRLSPARCRHVSSKPGDGSSFTIVNVGPRCDGSQEPKADLWRPHLPAHTLAPQLWLGSGERQAVCHRSTRHLCQSQLRCHARTCSLRRKCVPSWPRLPDTAENLSDSLVTSGASALGAQPCLGIAEDDCCPPSLLPPTGQDCSVNPPMASKKGGVFTPLDIWAK